MTKVIEAAIEKVKTITQDALGQFEEGSEEQQYATRLAELYFREWEKLADVDDDFVAITAGVINSLRDLQVRDYMMGIVSDIPNSRTVLEFLTSVTPIEYADPAFSLLSVVYYENGETEKALDTVVKANDKYPLATLLKRVYGAGWPKESFAQMRSELHPKVVTTIFGEAK
jgi:hypothetical protein